ncbi:exocyst complex component 2-like [Styela clava]
MGPPPVVTGVSPKFGTPLTKITIRGENLGTSKADLIGVLICNKDCTLTSEWQSNSKIVCRTGSGFGKGDIIVFTKSGGKGSSTVGFTGLPPKKVGPLEKSAVWVDESEYVDQRLDRNQKQTALSLRSDPLGLNSDDSVSRAPSNMNLPEMYPNGSPDPTDENFVPAWFLIERHFTTSFKELKEGHTYMKRRANKNTNNAPLNHVKDSLPVFFEVQEMLSSIHQRMIKDEAGRNNENITANLESLLAEASEKAGLLFTTVLNSKDRADSIRNTLGVLQRFKFLFYLPLNIQRNIEKGDYSVVINDYEKAKSLFAETDVSVFKRIYAEVEDRIAKFRVKLRNELVELPLPLYRQKSLIRYLLELHEQGDPAWDCLNNQHEWVQGQLLKCKDKYLLRANKEHNASSGDSSKTTDVPREFLEELAQLAVSQIPEHWHLWEQYSTGIILSETGEKSTDVDRLKQMASKHSKQMKGLLRDTIILFVNLLRAAFLPATLNFDDADEEDMKERTSYGIWPNAHIPANTLAECVRTARNVLRTLSQLKLAENTLQSLEDLIHDMRVLCLSSSMQEASSSISLLKREENWQVDKTGITSLPPAFENLVSKLIVTLQETLQSQGKEEGVFTREAVQSRVCELTTSLFTTYVSCMEQLAFNDATSNASATSTNVEPQIEKPALEKRIIIVLSNLRYAKLKIMAPMLQCFHELSFPKMQQTKEQAESAFVDLDERLFASYLEHRIEPLSATLEPGMYSGYFSWTDCVRPSGVRPYIKTALTGIITIHAEVYTISPQLVKRIIQETIKSLAEELLRLIQCVQKFSANGSLQARLGILALQQSTILYATEQSNKTFEDACAVLPQLGSGAEKKLLEELLNRFKSGMLFHLKCLEAPIDVEDYE